MAVIAIDFDHVIVDTPTTNPLPGVREAVSRLREAGHKIVIHSCNEPDYIAAWMGNNDIRFDRIWRGTGKPLADLYVDDKGFHFKGSWPTETDEVLARLTGLDNRKWKAQYAADKTKFEMEMS